MARLDATRGAVPGRSTGDRIIDWIMGLGHHADTHAQVVHLLPMRPPYHVLCRCGVATVEIGGEAWEIVVTQPRACLKCLLIQAARLAEIGLEPPLLQELATEQIEAWLAEHGDPRIKVEGVPEGVDVQSFARVYSHLEKLMAECPQAVPRDGIRLTFEHGKAHYYGGWNDAQHRLNLPARYYGSRDGLARLEERLGGAEARGSSPRGCRTPEYVIDHEYGHCLRHRLNGPRYARWWMDADKSGLGERGASDYSEGFAEGYAIIKQVPKEQWPDAVKALHEMLKEDGAL